MGVPGSIMQNCHWGSLLNDKSQGLAWWCPLEQDGVWRKGFAGDLKNPECVLACKQAHSRDLENCSAECLQRLPRGGDLGWGRGTGVIFLSPDCSFLFLRNNSVLSI